MTPTARMQTLTGPIRAALEQIEQSVFGSQEFDPLNTTTRFRLVASDYASALLVAKIMTKLASEMPNASLTVLNVDRKNAKEMLSKGENDVAVGLLPEAGKWTRRRKLFSESHVCVINPHLIEIGNRLTLDDYVEHNHMLVYLGGSESGFIDSLLKAKGKSRRIAVTTPYFLQSAYLLQRLPLIATLPLKFVNGCSSLSQLSTRTLPFRTPSFNTALLWRTADETIPRLLAIRDIILDLHG